MSIASLNAVGPVLAAEVGLLARNDAARRPEPVETVTVEVVRPLDAETRSKAEADVMRSVPETDRRRIDIRV